MRSLVYPVGIEEAHAALERFDLAEKLWVREGELACDLPASEVTRQRLERLYAQYEHELAGAPLIPPADGEESPSAVQMYCR